MLAKQFICNVCRNHLQADIDHSDMPVKGTLCLVEQPYGTLLYAMENCCGYIQICERCCKQLPTLIANRNP